MAQNIWDEYQAAYNQLHLIFIKQTGTTCSNLLMKQNGWIIWQVHLLFPWADGCLLACWQVYDKVFAIFNQVSSFTPISGPAQKQGQSRNKKNREEEKEQVCNKSLDEIVSFDNNNMRAVCPPSACLLISPVQPWPPDTAHYCKSVDITTVIST